jgi:peptidoglycan/LPS O-acetylase OafA/YrhL
MGPWIAGGWVGVDLFFVISGFLVAGLLFRELRDTGCVAPVHFLIRRGFKIYPAFYFMLVVSLLLARGTHPPGARILSELFFIQNYIGGLWNHTWSLAVEEHFYLLLALLFAPLTAARARVYVSLRSVLVSYLLIATVCLVLRLHLAISQPYDHSTHLFPTHLRIDSLFFGVLLSYLNCFHDSALRRFVGRVRIPLVLVSIALLSIPVLLPLGRNAFLSTYGLTLIAWGSGGLLLLAHYADIGDGWIVRGLARVGADSYSIYLWHMPVLLWLVPLTVGTAGLGVSYTWMMIVYVLAALVGGMWHARLIEWPMLRARDRYFPSRTKAGPVAQSPKQVFA